MQRKYTCTTKQGRWDFFADNDTDAMRLALFYTWRDGEDFIKVEFRKGCENYTLSIFHIDNNNHECFTL